MVAVCSLLEQDAIFRFRDICYCDKVIFLRVCFRFMVRFLPAATTCYLINK